MKPDRHLHSAADLIIGMNADIQAMIDAAPYQSIPIDPTSTPKDLSLAGATSFPARYRPEWERPMLDAAWVENHAKALKHVRDGGILTMIGNRGTGKTRLAAEVARDFAPCKSRYATAMGLFLRLRRSYHAGSGKSATECEDDIVNEMATTPLLVIDEIQERGNTEWEDRILTHIIDRRYGDRAATIIIANLSESELLESLGDSIQSRIDECGGMLEITGPSHRIKR